MTIDLTPAAPLTDADRAQMADDLIALMASPA